jgi:hypothetical protein
LWFNLLVMIPFNFDVELDHIPALPMITSQDAEVNFKPIYHTEQVGGYTHEAVFPAREIQTTGIVIQEYNCLRISNQIGFQI